jgi:membrane protein involved in colicin uptake
MSEQDQTQADVIQAEVVPVVASALSLVISTPDDYAAAAESLKSVKGAQKRVDAELIDPWRKVKANAAENMKKWDDLLMVPLRKAEDILKQKQLAYDAEQERIRLAEEKRLQDIENERKRKEQEKADAAVQAAKDKEAAALKEQQEAAQRAQDATNEEDRIKAQAEAAKAGKAAAAAAAKAAVREESAASVGPAAVISVARNVPKVAGQSIRKTWKARLTNLPALAGLPIGDVRLSFITFDNAAANRFAVATKGAVKVDGVEFYEESTLASSSR